MKLFIFGSTGDLAKRKVLPALHQLFDDGLDLEVFALTRKSLTNKEYGDSYCINCEQSFKSRLKHIEIDLDSNFSKTLERHLSPFEKSFFYISLPPKLSKSILTELKKIKEKGFRFSILLEKPFGESLDKAIELKDATQELKEELFLADHYLFKEEILSLDKINFKDIGVFSIEKLGLEGRNYYDEVGAINDMVQAHFLNILIKHIPDLKKNLKIFSIEKFVLKQYQTYKEELGKESDTETFVDITLAAGDKRFRFVTGKAFSKKESYLKVDKKRIDLLDKRSPYKKMFFEFFNSSKNLFPTIEDAIFSWKLLDWIKKQKPSLEFYKFGERFVENS